MPAMIRTLFALLLFLPYLAHAQMAPIIMTTTPTAEIAPQAKAPPPPVVLELFTSQGCAFCPPADKLMGEVIQQQGIIGLSCHVDYFGVKKNNLGRGFCTKRQMDYNRLIGNGPRYTPQLVINGRADVIGYEAGKVSAAILKARGQKIIPISIAKAGVDSYSFNLPQIALASPAQLWLAVYDMPKKLVMTEGSNFGKSVKYFNVVSRLEDLGAWDGSAVARALNANYAPNNGGIAILAQDIRSGHIIAAGQAVR